MTTSNHHANLNKQSCKNELIRNLSNFGFALDFWKFFKDEFYQVGNLEMFLLDDQVFK